jgi:hypothetical protein
MSGESRLTAKLTIGAAATTDEGIAVGIWGTRLLGEYAHKINSQENGKQAKSCSKPIIIQTKMKNVKVLMK